MSNHTEYLMEKVKFFETLKSLISVYRMYTNAWFHVGILHIALNMMSFLPMGTSMERSVGSASFFYLINLFW